MKTLESSSNNYDFEPAPLRFTPASNLDEPWQGTPSVPYGIVRHLAFKERQKSSIPYLRILFGEGGRRGDPWGGLHLEVNGHVYHFSAGMRRHPELHNGQGGLSQQGLESIAEGVPGELTFDITDWRWIQDEVDITVLFSEVSIERIATHFAALKSGAIPLPGFQSQVWAKRFKKPFKDNYHNCTTIIALVLSHELKTPLSQNMPLQLFNVLKEMRDRIDNNFQSELDAKLNTLLWLAEADIEKLFISLVPIGTDIDAVAKGITQPPPKRIVMGSIDRRRMI